MVCAVQRTGSTVVIDDLANLVGDYPFDTEYLYGKSVLEREGRSWDEIWKLVRGHCHIRDYIVNKVMFHYVPYISTVIEGGTVTRKRPVYEFSSERFDSFYNFFRGSTWVYVERTDVFAQAVSMYFAEMTQFWEIRPGKSKVTSRPAGHLPYDRARLARYVQGFAAEYAGWEKFFAHYGIDPVRIKYEDAVADYPAYLGDLTSALGIVYTGAPPPRRMAKVGDAVNDRFARTLRRDIVNHPILRSILTP